ncbi:MAG: AI-2E family transporter [Chthoniobacterales bacterium]|nr:AI-2E family transporter [Chthoniobacterales bacterium]
MQNGIENRLGGKGSRGLMAAGWLIVIAISLVLIRVGKDLFIPLVIALIGVYLIKILERWIGYIKISGRGLPPVAALALAFAAVIGLSFVLFSIIADNAVRVAEFAPRYQIRLLAIQSDLFRTIGFEEPPAIRQFFGGFDLPGTLALVAMNLATLLRNAILILIFGVFLLLEAQFIPTKIAAIFPDANRRALVQGILKRVDRDIQTYFGVKTLVSLITAILSYAVMKFVDLDFAAFWALLVFILNFIPTIGSIIATILPGLLALVQFEEWRPVLILVVGITLIQQLLGNIIEPNLMGITLNLSPLVVVMSLILWGMLWGVVGMFLCVPITVILLIILANFPSTNWVAVLLSKDGVIQR